VLKITVFCGRCSICILVVYLDLGQFCNFSMAIIVIMIFGIPPQKKVNFP
jgi:hypothetical protein